MLGRLIRRTRVEKSSGSTSLSASVETRPRKLPYQTELPLMPEPTGVEIRPYNELPSSVVIHPDRITDVTEHLSPEARHYIDGGKNFSGLSYRAFVGLPLNGAIGNPRHYITVVALDTGDGYSVEHILEKDHLGSGRYGYAYRNRDNWHGNAIFALMRGWTTPSEKEGIINGFVESMQELTPDNRYRFSQSPSNQYEYPGKYFLLVNTIDRLPVQGELFNMPLISGSVENQK